MLKISSRIGIVLILVVLFTACAPNFPTPPPAEPVATTQPTEPVALSTQAAVQPVATALVEPTGPTFVVFDPQSGTLRSYNMDGSLRFEAPAPEMQYPNTNTITVLKDTVYYASEGADKSIYRASAAGTQQLGLSIGNLSAFRVSPDEEWIAWSVLNMETNPPVSQLWIKRMDEIGVIKEAKLAADLTLGMGQPLALMPLRWAEDNSGRLYFERARTGLGGYSLYEGRFSLYAYDTASGQITTYIDAEENRGSCLDDFRLDLMKVSFHCGKDNNLVAIRSLQDNTENSLPELMEQGAAGSGRFSPTGQWLAYAVARRNPDDEAGQVAVAPTDQSAAPRVIVKVAQKRYPVVQGWLDEDTLLVTIANFNDPRHTILTIKRDGTEMREIMAGVFIGWSK